MNHTFGNLIYRVFFIISFILLILAIWERINQFLWLHFHLATISAGTVTAIFSYIYDIYHRIIIKTAPGSNESR